MATKLIWEIFDEINEDVSKLAQYKANGAVRLILEHAYLPEKKFALPEGDPPYKDSPHPIGMSETTLLHEAKRLYVFCREDLKPIKRESLFIELLENIDVKDAKILLAVKEQKLSKLYKKITKAACVKAGIINDPKDTNDQPTG